jgi:sugar phosphate isomerase/epimerase
MIYISTGGYSNLTLLQATNLLLNNGFVNLELSGCRWEQGDIESIMKLKNSKFSFQPHNYFPSQEKSFVLNLASLDETISAQSLSHCEKAIQLSAALGQKYYSIHAGFLMDPNVNELGKTISKRTLNNREQAIEKFERNITHLIAFSMEYQVRLLIENNVLNKDNGKEFQQNPLLMVDPIECAQIMDKFSKKVGMLLDVAHLKVSAKTLGFLPEKVFVECDKYIEAYHLSDNNGLVDENKPFTDSSWFWEYLKPNKDYVSIEVYTFDFLLLKQLLNLTHEKLDKK